MVTTGTHAASPSILKEAATAAETGVVACQMRDEAVSLDVVAAAGG